MAPIVSEFLTAEKQFFNSPAFTHECSYSPVGKNIDSYYLLTDFLGISSMSISNNIITYSVLSSQTIFSRQMSIVSLSNQMFHGSQPMTGRELGILKKTASRLISKTPTTLHKN